MRQTPPPSAAEEVASGKAALTDAIKQLDLVHVTLIGLVGIVVMLFVGIALPVFGRDPISSPLIIIIMALTTTAGIIYLYWQNLGVHKLVTSQARLTEVLVNSLGQGFLTFDAKGVCGKVYSQACLDLFGVAPANKQILDVMQIAPDKREDFSSWLAVMFDPTHALGFDDAIKFLPDMLESRAERHISLSYRDIRNQAGLLVQVVVIATDRTEEVAAVAAAREQQDYAAMIVRIFQERNQFVTTIRFIRDFVAKARGSNILLSQLPDMLRELHTMKGAVRHFNLVSFGRLVHDLEDKLRDPALNTTQKLTNALQEVALAVEQALEKVLQELKGLISEEESARGNLYQISEDKIYEFKEFLQQQGVPLAVLDFYRQQIAAIPMRECFASFARELRELAEQFDRKLNPLVFKGANPRILAKPLQEFFFSLTHMANNIIDHGIEAPVTRMSRGKDATGTVSVEIISPSTGPNPELTLLIADDGAGIDPSRIRQKLATIDPEGSWRFEDDQTIIQRIFDWGISTRDGTSVISGRGVGLEAVAQAVKQLGGTIRVSSEIYQGTRFEIKIPLRDMV